MIRANLIKSFQAEGGRKKAIPEPLCLWYYSQHSERDVFLRWNTAEERKGLYTSKRVVRPLSCCRWLNFARIPRTKIAIRAGATSEFFMPANRGYEQEAATACSRLFFMYILFLLSSPLPSSPPTSISFFLLLPSVFHPLLAPSFLSLFLDPLSPLSYDLGCPLPSSSRSWNLGIEGKGNLI